MKAISIVMPWFISTDGNACLVYISEKNIKNLLCDPFKLAFLRDLYNGNYYADLTKKSTDAGQAASFRKLNIS